MCFRLKPCLHITYIRVFEHLYGTRFLLYVTLMLQFIDEVC
jgi:hypothetical protein